MVTSMLSGLSFVTSASCAPQFGQKYRTQVDEDSYRDGVPAIHANAEAGTVIVEIQDGAQKVVSAVGQFANQLSS